MIDRRTMLLSAGASAATVGLAKAHAAGLPPGKFPGGFLWGVATSGHQTEGNNVASDSWLLENTKPSGFAEPSGDAVNSFALWPSDLDLVRKLGLNSYRFSLEWARIEPEAGQFSLAMLGHYKAMIEGCRSRQLTPVVTFNHFSTPRWFAAAGGWANAAAPELFGRFCERAARHLAADIGYAVTLNEPNLPALLRWSGIPAQVYAAQQANRAAAARAVNSETFMGGFLFSEQEFAPMIPNLLAAHRRGRDAIKSIRPDLRVGMSLAISDDQAVGARNQLEAKRAAAYEPWMELARSDDFIGVQNYDRSRLDASGQLPSPAGAVLNTMGSEVYPASLEGAVRYAHKASGRPVLVTEHGLGTDDDALRASFIPAALRGLRSTIGDGVPVIGYIHWSLLDNFEWYFGFKPRFGLVEVDRKTFARTPKVSASVLGEIARLNAVGS